MKGLKIGSLKSLFCFIITLVLCAPLLVACGAGVNTSSASEDKSDNGSESKAETESESNSQTETETPKGILPEKSEYKLLFIGNSATYVHDIPATLASLCQKKGITITQYQIVPGGCTLEQHAANPQVFAEIEKGYDAVFIQENGNSIVSETERIKSLDACKKIGEAVNKTGAKFCYYVRPPYGIDLGGYKNFDQCKLFDDHFTPAAKAYNASCVYVNRAFAYAIKNLNYNLWGEDNAHTSTHGAYLAVCTFYATLFGESATTLGSAYGLPLAEAEELQKAADKIAFENVIPWS
ncbi:MAG: hypothetical protein E7586_01285 [Ruminococcaceae bacterium]|nr:hypothetical protein [Oscillospiraceae bacterium]